MGSDIAKIMKSRRKELGLSVKSVLEQLSSYGICISDKTFYGWESGHRQPDSDTFLIICRIYGIDSLSYFLDIKEVAPLCSSEAEAVARDYDSLDGHGKRAVRAILDEEKARMSAEAEKHRQTAIQNPVPQVPELSSDLARELAELKRQNQELAAKVADMEEEDAMCGLGGGIAGSNVG